ncbi:hypothetical protein JB92DRAFT_2867047 [Gautieria morchelliformis]|nr:hypothetical protein JB92DRAFT_2867047 [Gautieria morchelliformis]
MMTRRCSWLLAMTLMVTEEVYVEAKKMAASNTQASTLPARHSFMQSRIMGTMENEMNHDGKIDDNLPSKKCHKYMTGCMARLPSSR